MQASPLFSLSPSSPSFNSYSSANLAEVAARVVEEFRKESDLDSSIYEWETDSLFSEEREPEECEKNQDSNKNQEDEHEDEHKDENEEEEFEFAIVCRRSDSAISADEIFFNGQIRPIYPVFDKSLLLNDTSINQNAENSNSSSSTPSLKTSTRLPLGKLMSEERETTTSSSSSEADDLDNLQPGTYCVWKPKAKPPHQDLPGRSCEKSNSTGSSKRWKFRDLLYRSNSDGKDTFVFLTPHKKTADSKDVVEESSKEIRGKVKVVEEHYVKNNRGTNEEDKSKSLLPHRQDIVGFFNNVNGFSRKFHPF